MRKHFHDEHLPILQAIETAIVDIYDDTPQLTDHNVNKAVNGLIRGYKADLKGHDQPDPGLKDIESTLYDAIREVCEAWLAGENAYDKPLIIDVLKRIQKSIRLWTKDYGVRGYLDYVQQFISDAP